MPKLTLRRTSQGRRSLYDPVFNALPGQAVTFHSDANGKHAMTEEPAILVVDDSANDALLMRTVFSRAGLVRPLRFARDGEQAIAVLSATGGPAAPGDSPPPTVVLLDLNMPRKSGFEVIAWIREQPTLRDLRVYVLSSSTQPEDIRRAYDLGADAYLVKPANLDGLIQLAKTVVAWHKLVQVPPRA